MNSAVHAMLDLLNDLLLLLAAMSIGPIQAYRGHPESGGLARVLLPIVLSLSLWQLRTLEIALFSNREAARRQASMELCTNGQTWCCWCSALILSQSWLGDDAAQLVASDGAVALMWLGNLWSLFRRAQIPLVRYLLGWGRSASAMLEQSYVVNNHSFVASRHNEFMFLMLGETLLQIVISSGNELGGEGLASDLFNATTLSATAGLVLAAAVMFSFRQMVNEEVGNDRKVKSGVREIIDERERTRSRVLADVRRSSQCCVRATTGEGQGNSPEATRCTRETNSRDTASPDGSRPPRRAEISTASHGNNGGGGGGGGSSCLDKGLSFKALAKQCVP